jgi:phosphohistidine phosphatase
MERKRLVLLRHAKSSWDDVRLADHDRPLTARGRKAAGAIGQYLRDHRLAPELVLCSSACRTRQTLERLHLGDEVTVVVEDELYGAGADVLLERLRRIHAPVNAAMLIGHNPGIQELAITLADNPARLGSFPTAALAELDVPFPTWDLLAPGGSKLRTFVTPRELG